MKLCTRKPAKDVSKWLKKYFRQLDHDEATENTFKIYSRILDSFYGYVLNDKDIESIKEIDSDYILDFVDSLEDQYRERENNNALHFSTSTTLLYIMVLKGFFSFIEDKVGVEEDGTKFTFQNEFKHLTKKKSKRNKKRRENRLKYLDSDEITNLIDYLDYMIESRGSYYDYIHSYVIKLMLFGGLRVSEALGIRFKDMTLSEDNTIIRIVLPDTKSQEQQTVPVRLSHLEQEFIYINNLPHKEKNTYIFTTKNNISCIDRSNLYRAVNRIYEKAGVDKKGLHILRHTAAMLLLDGAKDVSLVKDLLRHSDISTTMIYVNRTAKQLEEKII